jgi:hypothetical protein
MSTDDLRPLGVEQLAGGPVDALAGMGAEEVALHLQQVGRQAGAAVGVVVGERGAYRRHRHARTHGQRDDVAPQVLRLVERLLEERRPHQVRQVGVEPVGRGDVVQEAGADDAAAAPDARDAAEIEAPALLAAHRAHQVQALLRVADDLARVDGLVQLVDHLAAAPCAGQVERAASGCRSPGAAPTPGAVRDRAVGRAQC